MHRGQAPTPSPTHGSFNVHKPVPGRPLASGSSSNGPSHGHNNIHIINTSHSNNNTPSYFPPQPPSKSIQNLTPDPRSQPQPQPHLLPAGAAPVTGRPQVQYQYQPLYQAPAHTTDRRERHPLPSLPPQPPLNPSRSPAPTQPLPPPPPPGYQNGRPLIEKEEDGTAGGMGRAPTSASEMEFQTYTSPLMGLPPLLAPPARGNSISPSMRNRIEGEVASDGGSVRSGRSERPVIGSIQTNLPVPTIPQLPPSPSLDLAYFEGRNPSPNSAPPTQSTFSFLSAQERANAPPIPTLPRIPSAGSAVSSNGNGARKTPGGGGEVDAGKSGRPFWMSRKSSNSQVGERPGHGRRTSGSTIASNSSTGAKTLGGSEIASIMAQKGAASPRESPSLSYSNSNSRPGAVSPPSRGWTTSQSPPPPSSFRSALGLGMKRAPSPRAEHPPRMNSGESEGVVAREAEVPRSGVAGGREVGRSSSTGSGRAQGESRSSSKMRSTRQVSNPTTSTANLTIPGVPPKSPRRSSGASMHIIASSAGKSSPGLQPSTRKPSYGSLTSAASGGSMGQGLPRKPSNSSLGIGQSQARSPSPLGGGQQVQYGQKGKGGRDLPPINVEAISSRGPGPDRHNGRDNVNSPTIMSPASAGGVGLGMGLGMIPAPLTPSDTMESMPQRGASLSGRSQAPGTSSYGQSRPPPTIVSPHDTRFGLNFRGASHPSEYSVHSITEERTSEGHGSHTSPVRSPIGLGDPRGGSRGFHALSRQKTADKRANRSSRCATLEDIMASREVQAALFPHMSIASFLALLAAIDKSWRKMILGETVGRWVCQSWGLSVGSGGGLNWPGLGVWEGFLESLLHNVEMFPTYPGHFKPLLQHLCLSYTLIVTFLRSLPVDAFPTTPPFPFEEEATLQAAGMPKSLSSLTLATTNYSNRRIASSTSEVGSLAQKYPHVPKAERPFELVMPEPLGAPKTASDEMEVIASDPVLAISPNLDVKARRRRSSLSSAASFSVNWARKGSMSNPGSATTSPAMSSSATFGPANGRKLPPVSFPSAKRYKFRGFGEPTGGMRSSHSRTFSDSGSRPGSIFSVEESIAPRSRFGGMESMSNFNSMPRYMNGRSTRPPSTSDSFSIMGRSNQGRHSPTTGSNLRLTSIMGDRGNNHSPDHLRSRTYTPEVVEPAFDKPIPYVVGRCPIFRVFVPLTTEITTWPCAEGARRARKELERCGAWNKLKIGDVIVNTAIQEPLLPRHLMLFIPLMPPYLCPLEYRYSPSGHLPNYLDAFTIPPSFYYPLLFSNRYIIFLDLTPWAQAAYDTLRLAFERSDITTTRGDKVTAKRYLHIIGISIHQDAQFTANEEWFGSVTIEAEGTAEGRGELLRRLGKGRDGRDVGRPVRGPFEVVREKSLGGNVWLRLVPEITVTVEN